MKTSFSAIAGAAIVTFGAPLFVGAATPKSDIIPPQRRQLSVDIAERLAQRKAPDALPAEHPSPFNPADFDKPEPGSRPVAAPSSGQPAPAPAAVAGDREILEMLAGQITPSGMFVFSGRPRLIIKGKPFEVGTRFTVTYKDQDYELELVAIQGNNFTLRYRNEETTRPIKPVR